MNRNGEEAAEEVRAWLETQTFGSLSPKEVVLRREEDSTGEPPWFFDIVLPDPDPSDGTWPVDDLEKLDRETRDQALAVGLPWPWHVQVRPETDEAQADEDALDDQGH